jgi:hypothetical protein
MGTAASSACVYGINGVAKSARRGATSTSRPAYITATRSAMWATTARSCAMNR